MRHSTHSADTRAVGILVGLCWGLSVSLDLLILMNSQHPLLDEAKE